MGTRPQPAETAEAGLLAAPGVSPTDETLYRSLLHQPHATLADLASDTGGSRRAYAGTCARSRRSAC